MNTLRKLLLPALTAFTLMSLLSFTPASLAAPAEEVPIGDTVRNIRMNGLNGPSKQLADFRGKPLVVNMWASWCGPCRQEMGSLERLFWRYGGRQFNVIGISTDDYRDKAAGFLDKSNTSFNNYIDEQLVLEKMFGGNRIPLTVLIDAEGKIVGKFYGAKEWDSPEALKLIATTLKLKL